VVDAVYAKGLGAAELALRQLKEKLAGLGYFAQERKRPLPRFPRRVGLITSPTGAAVRDMLEVLGRRWPYLEIWICPVRVQGAGAAEEVTRALRLFDQIAGIDVVIVGRGGGSTEDLWAFNAESVAHAIFNSRTVVISAVGHEIDVTIADLVADHRALTPSEAAERCVPDRKEILAQLQDLANRSRVLLIRQLERAKSKLDDLGQRRPLRLPLERLQDRARGLDDLAERLEKALKQRLCQMRERLAGHAARLESLSPLNVLARGYSLTRREPDQMVVRAAQQVHPGDVLATRLQRGTIISRVEQVEP
jgi:exodeoxyribonuclease VII large subunit